MATAWTQIETGTTTAWRKNRFFPATGIQISDMTHDRSHFP